jgi:signal transduction histidine kinase
VPSWLAPLAGGTAWGVALIGLAALLSAARWGLPDGQVAGALLVVPAVAAGWLVGRPWFLAVLALSVADEALAAAIGLWQPPQAVAMAVAVLAAGIGVRLGAHARWHEESAAGPAGDTAMLRQRLEAVEGGIEDAVVSAPELVGRDDPGALLEVFLDRARRAVATDSARVVEVQAGRIVAPGETWPLPAESPLTEAVSSGRPRWSALAEARLPAVVAARLAEAGIGHLLWCPLGGPGAPAGVLELRRSGSAGFGPADRLRLEPLVTLAGLALLDAGQLAEARQRSRARSEVLHVAAHELRTPLTVIRGYLALLQDGTYQVPEQTREVVATLAAKAGELDSLVEALLTEARGDVSSAVSADFDVRQAVRQAVERLQPRARLEQAQITVRVPDQPAVARADRGQVARILDNLLNNAISYSLPPASVSVEVRCGDEVEVAVADRGQGIPPEHQTRIFERFVRLDSGRSRFSSGLGLGLALSRELAHANGGALVLERSYPGQGSVFVLRLPRG